MPRHILLKKNSAITPLIATKSHQYRVKVSDDCVENWSLMDEAWLVTNVYLKNRNSVSKGLRSRHPDIAPDEIDRFIDAVKADHPLQFVDFRWEDIPLYADSDSYCELYLPWLYKHSIKLTLEQETELLEIAQGEFTDKKDRMIHWFRRYRNDYGIETRLKRDMATQDVELAEMFCMVHGFELDMLSSAQDQTVCETQKHKRLSAVRNISLFMLVAVGPVFLGVWGIQQDGIIFPVLCTVPFFILIGIIAKLLGMK